MNPASAPPSGNARPSDGGAISIFLTVLFSAALLFAGLIFDAGRVLHANSETFDLAGKAARVGAQELDFAALQVGIIRLDPAAATRAAESYLQDHDIAGTATVTDATVTVTAVSHIDYRLLAVVKPAGATVTQTRSATATPGP
ncbi:pilus assembly protein TadG-related protein [Frankia sp. CiP3]|uniref:pilus assembly protein TadG-related protein n=1 Tax=Frankia sp. CiP3 TaxID=2880971 RepID=UPI001EF56490|nr:pilus assembly protein TadG-related protein [Frankia sp. CiP3]